MILMFFPSFGSFVEKKGFVIGFKGYDTFVTGRSDTVINRGISFIFLSFCGIKDYEICESRKNI